MVERPDDLTPDDVGPLGRTDPSAGDAADTAAIRADIRDTRERLGETVEAIGERLNPQHLKQQVRQDIREATIGRVETMAHNAADRVNETRRTITDTIRENPIPAAMVGIGLGWLFFNGRKQHGQDERYGGWSGAASSPYAGGGDYRGRAAGGYASGYGASSGYGATAGYAGGGYAGGGYAGAGSDEPGALDRVRDRAADVGDRVSDVASGAAERAQDAASSVAHHAHEMADTVASQARYQARRVEDHYYESPFAIGAVTLALGVAAGLAVPATHREVQIMGATRDQLVDRVRDVAEDTVERVQHVAERVAEEAQSTAKEAAREEGLTGSGGSGVGGSSGGYGGTSSGGYGGTSSGGYGGGTSGGV